MVLAKCRKCGGDVSGWAYACPHCGDNVHSPFMGRPGTITHFLNVVCLALLFFFGVIAAVWFIKAL